MIRLRRLIAALLVINALAILARAAQPSSEGAIPFVVFPSITLFFLYQERTNIFRGASPFPGRAIPPLIAALLCCALFAAARVQGDAVRRSVPVASVVTLWLLAFALAYGFDALRSASFALLFLAFLVPIPQSCMDAIIGTLQSGSALATGALFNLAGVPVFRDGMNFQLPGVNIEVARECSSIHSASALFVTGLILGRLLLRSLYGRTLLCVLAAPIAMFTNGVRIVSIWFLGMKVSPGFFYGNLHRNGGMLFSLISVLLLWTAASALRRLEGRRVPPRLILQHG